MTDLAESSCELYKEKHVFTRSCYMGYCWVYGNSMGIWDISGFMGYQWIYGISVGLWQRDSFQAVKCIEVKVLASIFD